MSAKWLGHKVMDFGLDHLENNADQISVLDDYNLGEDYATVMSNSLGNVAISGTDISLSTVNTNDRRATIAAKTVNASRDSIGAPPALHVAVVDTTLGDVLAVFEEVTNQVITDGNDVNVPALTLDIQQPI